MSLCQMGSGSSQPSRTTVLRRVAQNPSKATSRDLSGTNSILVVGIANSFIQTIHYSLRRKTDCTSIANRFFFNHHFQQTSFFKKPRQFGTPFRYVCRLEPYFNETWAVSPSLLPRQKQVELRELAVSSLKARSAKRRSGEAGDVLEGRRKGKVSNER